MLEGLEGYRVKYSTNFSLVSSSAYPLQMSIMGIFFKILAFL